MDQQQQHWNCSSFCKLSCKFFLPRESSPYYFSRILSGGASRLNKYVLHTAQFPTSQIANLFQIGILVYRLILVLVSQKRPIGWYDSVGRQLTGLNTRYISLPHTSRKSALDPNTRQKPPGCALSVLPSQKRETKKPSEKNQARVCTGE